MINRTNKKTSVRPFKTRKGFKIISCPRRVLEAATCQKRCVCDNCLDSPDTGYYVAVLNQWFCPSCYTRWIKSAKRYKEDVWIEEKNYEYYMSILKQYDL